VSQEGVITTSGRGCKGKGGLASGRGDRTEIAAGSSSGGTSRDLGAHGPETELFPAAAPPPPAVPVIEIDRNG